MTMRHCLAGTGAVCQMQVEAVAVDNTADVLCQLGCQADHPRQAVRGYSRHAGVVLFRNQQGVSGIDRRDIEKCQYQVVFEQDCGVDLASDNTAERAIVHGCSILRQRARCLRLLPSSCYRLIS